MSETYRISTIEDLSRLYRDLPSDRGERMLAEVCEGMRLNASLGADAGTAYAAVYVDWTDDGNNDLRAVLLAGSDVHAVNPMTEDTADLTAEQDDRVLRYAEALREAATDALLDKAAEINDPDLEHTGERPDLHDAECTVNANMLAALLDDWGTARAATPSPQAQPVAWRAYFKDSAEIWGKPSWFVIWTEADFPPETIREHYHIEPVFSGATSPPHDQVEASQAAADVLAERRRQVEVEGWTPEHDDEHSSGEMLTSALCYVQQHDDERMFGHSIDKRPAPARWPWDVSWWKPKGKRRDLVRAAALIIAEIERLDRAQVGEGNG